MIGATKESLVRQVNEVGPVLSTLIDNMDRMRPLMQGVLDFGKALDSASPGDYARFDLTALLAPGDLSNLRLPGLPGRSPAAVARDPPTPGLPSLPEPARGRHHRRRPARVSADCWEVAADAAVFANRVRTAQILLLVVVIVGALYVMDAVVGSGLVTPPLRRSPSTSQASGGLYPGAVVSYRGNRIGKITDLDVTADGVRATALDRRRAPASRSTPRRWSPTSRRSASSGSTSDRGSTTVRG